MKSKYAGYMGKVMLVDLTTETVTEYPWSDEERELFSSYIHTRKAKEQFIKSIDSISMAAYTGYSSVHCIGRSNGSRSILDRNIH